MILAALVAASLIVPAATDAGASWPPPSDHAGASLRHMSVQEKRAVVRPLRFTTLVHAGDVNDLIVESVPSCLDAVRAMIDAHDRLFGEGAGETFFMGPYLDALPGAVHDLVKDTR
jgi:hypothetical protein